MENEPFPEAVSLPTRAEADSSKRSELMKLFDNEAEDPNERFQDFDLEEDDSIKYYYAVAAGRQTGIFIEWNVCNTQTNGYAGACFKKFTSLEEAKRFLIMKTTNTTEEDIDDNGSLKNTKLTDHCTVVSQPSPNFRRVQAHPRRVLNGTQAHTRNSHFMGNSQTHNRTHPSTHKTTLTSNHKTLT